jgi:uncharacterized protein with NRDE domain
VCTIIAINAVHPVAPLIVAANRDEIYARPAAAPKVLADDPRVVGGQDLQDGGTWMGLSDRGLFVGLTNIFTLTQGDYRSRGEIVLELSKAAGVDEALARLDAMVSDALYRPFNLLVGSASALHYARLDESEGLTIRVVEPGVHVLPSTAALDDLGTPKVAHAMALLEGVTDITNKEALLAHLFELIGNHEQPERLPEHWQRSPFGDDFDRALQSLCVHTEHYGTRSAQVALGLDGGEWEMGYCEGPPCTGRLEDQGQLWLTRR